MNELDEFEMLANQGNWEEIKSRIRMAPKIALTNFTYSQTLLTALSSFGNVEIIELLLFQGADSNHIDEFGQTPLLDALGGAKEGRNTLSVQ